MRLSRSRSVNLDTQVNLRLDKWVYMGTFGYSADIYAKGSRRVLVDKNSGEVICRYVLEKGPGDEKRNAGNAEKGVKA